MAVGQPSSKEMSGVFEAPKPNLEGTPAADITFVAGLEAQEIQRTYGDEAVQEFAGHAAPLEKVYRAFEETRLAIQADTKLTSEGKQEAIALEAGKLNEVINSREEQRTKYVEEYTANEENLVKAGMITRPANVPEDQWNRALDNAAAQFEVLKNDPLKRLTVYNAECARFNSENDPERKAALAPNLAFMETTQVFQTLQGATTGNIVPFVRDELEPDIVRERRLERASLAHRKTVELMSRNRKMSVAIATVTGFAKRRLAELLPDDSPEVVGLL